MNMQNPARNALKRCFSNFFVNFDLVRISYCTICYLRYVLRFYKRRNSTCEDNNWIDGKLWQRFYMKRLQTFFTFSFFTVFIFKI